jgi:uncharacterized protein
MKKIDAWLLTEGAHGMISQVEGLAKSLNVNYQHKKINYNKLWSLFPPRFTPKNEFVFNCNEIINDKSNIQNPTLLISCGRKSVIPSIVIKNYFKKKNNQSIFNIHIQDPKIDIKNFNFVIVPEHDGIRGDNIITTKGAIHYISSEEIITARKNIQPENVLTVILGGLNKYYLFGLDEIKNLFNTIEHLFFNKVDQVKIICSRRTPENIINFLKEKYIHNSKIIIDTSLQRQNYINALAEAKKIIVTSDSISMISEAATTGTPIYVAQLTPNKNDYRFNKFIELFKSLNIIKDLNASEEYWTYDGLYETKRVADIIKTKIT